MSSNNLSSEISNEDDMIPPTLKEEMKTVHQEEIFGHTVHSEEEAFKMYSEYALKCGFSVRKQHVFYWTHTRIIKGREFSCSKAGFKIHKACSDVQKKFRQSDTRTGCLACLHFTADKDGKNWKVLKFIEEHNHPLALQQDAHLLRSHRRVSNGQAMLIKNMRGVGIRTIDAFNLMAGEVGGAHNLGFTKGDAYNFVQRERKALIETGDAAKLLEIFKERQLLDNMFSFDIQTDEMNRLHNFFWIDGLAKLDYECFGDVIIFDTTYRMNKYNLACAPFISVNNHWQNVFVGCAFVAHETIESFCWVFQSFLKFVGGKQPITIYTDQDQAMTVAIEMVFPSTRHRLCQWHISKKAPSKVPAFNQNKDIRSLFFTCMSKCDTELEFELYWSQILTQGNLQDNRWLSDLYNIKKKWSTAFNKDVFDLGILSTQRSESANHSLHGCSNTTSSLAECFLGVEKLIDGWRRREHEEDFKCKQGSISLKFNNCLILKQMSKIYTRKIYSIFEHTFMEGVLTLLVAEQSIYDQDTIVYITRLTNNCGFEKQWIVTVNTKSNDVDCSCRGFQTKGLLCEHALRVYHFRNVQNIPPTYILRRFTMQAKKRNKFAVPTTSNHYESNLIFRNQMLRCTYDLCQRIENCQIAKEYMVNVFNDVGEVLEDMVDKDEKKKKGIVDKLVMAKGVLKDPVSMRPKGAPKTRLKSYWESTSKKSKKSRVAKGKAPAMVDYSVPPQEHNFMDISCDVDSNSNPTPPNGDLVDDFSINDDLSINVPFNFSCIPDVFKW